MSGFTLSAMDCFNVCWVWHVLQQNQAARVGAGVHQVVRRNLPNYGQIFTKMVPEQQRRIWTFLTARDRYCLASAAKGMGPRALIMQHELCPNRLPHSPDVNESSFALRFPQNLMLQLFSFLTTQEMRSLSEVDESMAVLSNREQVADRALK
jgi:hypothetical protein